MDGAGFVLVPGFAEADRAEVVALMREYEADLGVSLCFQDFEAELAGLPGPYAPPGGELILACARHEHAPAGCVAVRSVSGRPGWCEMKRMFVRPAARGRGLGRMLALAALEHGRRLGYGHMCLDTLPFLTTAQTLYRDLGFRQVGTAPGPPQVLLFERALHA
jgi:GNAT superfamily N-acetyltransferase